MGIGFKANDWDAMAEMADATDATDATVKATATDKVVATNNDVKETK